MDRRTWISAAAVAPLVLGARRSLRAQTPAVLRVGEAPRDSFAQGYYALDGGFFQRAGLNVEVQTFTGGSAIAAAVASGALDIGITTPLQVANAVLHGIPLAIIAAGGLSTAKVPSVMLVVAKSAPLRSAKDLEGKAVAINSLKTVTQLAMTEWLGRNGTDPGKVRLVEMTYSEMGPAIQRGTVEAAVLSEPVLSASLKLNDLRVFGDPNGAIAPQFLVSAWFTSADYARKNSEIVRRYAAVIHDVARWANTHQRETGDILAKYGKVDPDVVRGMLRCPFAEALRLADIQPLLDLSTKAGLLSRQVSASELVFRP